MADQLGGASGNATSAQLLEGYTASNAQGPISGAIPIVSGGSVAPSTTSQTAVNAATYVQNAVTVDAIQGTATTADVLPSATFSSQNGVDQTGTMATVTGGNTVVPTTANQTAIAGATYAENAITVQGDANLVASNILNGVSIFEVAGSAKRMATGTIFVSTAIANYWTINGSASSDQQSQSFAYCSYSGLSFTPSLIVLVSQSNDCSMTVYSTSFAQGLGGYTGNYYVQCAAPYLESSEQSMVAESQSGYQGYSVQQGGWTNLPVIISNENYTWFAFE